LPGEWLSASIKILQQFVAHSIEFSPGKQRSVHLEWKNEDQLREEVLQKRYHR
jgi:hypothetical protein